jgi:hypothetical protein
VILRELKYRIIVLISILFISSNCAVNAQEAELPTELVKVKPTTSVWFNNYWNMRVSDKLFWAGELHYRTTERNNVPFVGRTAQVYNRHGIKYMFSKNFNMTAGGVLRLDFTPDPGNSDFNAVIVEPRLWHEYFFGMPFSYSGVNFMVYHRLRFEHRWSKSNLKGADYIYRNRYRYKFMMKIPLNKRSLTPGTYYFNPDVEIIMQSGRTVMANPLEDLRIYPNFGYIFNPRVSGSMGMMYTTGQIDMFGYEYRQRWIWKFNIYLSIDGRKFEDKLPPVNFDD